MSQLANIPPRIAALALATVLSWPVAASGAGPLRYAVALDERITVEGSATALERRSVEAALAEALLAKGLTLVDAEQSRAVRKAVDPRAVLNGGPLGPVTTADADVVVVGLVTGTVSKPMKLDVYGAHLNAQLRVVAVDSGDVAAATSATAIERDFTVDQAIFHAAKKLADSLATEIAAKAAGVGERRLELHVSTEQPLEVQVLERIQRGIESQSGVTSVRVTHTDDRAVHLEVRAKGTDTRALALALSEQRGSGLFIWGYSERIIRAKVRLSGALGLRLVPTKFTAVGGRPAGAADASELLPRGLATGLASDGLFALDASSELAAAPTPAARKALFGALAKRPEETVVLVGSFTARPDRTTLSASLVRARDGKSVAEGAAECAAGKLTECTHELSARLAKLASSSLQSASAQAASASARRPVRVLGVTLADVFPSQLVGRGNASSEAEAGDFVELTNDGEDTVEDLQITPSIAGLTKSALPSARVSLKAKETARVPIRLLLDPDVLREHDRNETAVLRLELSYRIGEFAVHDHSKSPVTVYHRNALSWADPASVAGFVTATSDPIQRAARGALSSLDAAERQEPLAVAVALFQQLHHLAYVADPVNPYAAGTIDYVEYPAQTLVRGAGDCDDLAVLYAALVEAVGLPALLVTTPGHIFVAVPTSRPANSLETGIDPHAPRLLQADGRYWAPIETSLVGRSFDEAWTKGASLVAAAKKAKKLGVIDVRRAWAKYPPVDLTPASERTPTVAPVTSSEVMPRAKQAAERLASELGSALSGLDAAIAKRPTDAELLNRRGIALVALGRLQEAEAAFTKSVELKKAIPGATNNLGNLSLLTGDPLRALHWYDEAAQQVQASEEARRCIILNRLLAAWLHDRSGSRFLELVLGASDGDLKAFYAGVNGGPLRGSVEVDPVRAAAEKQLRPDAGAAQATDDNTPVPVGRLVRWL
ncbi:hypothetical protein L6R52_35730 [Myxococcota bacterium]|nr:hypothetical protein [Myxococcota bacterium]